MSVQREEVVGKPIGAAKVHLERGPISAFAAAVTDDNPIYSNLEAARAAGFDQIPAPPTFTFAASSRGTFAEDQPPDPTGGRNYMAEVMASLMAEGGLVLHGEQEFTYHKPVQAGDVLRKDSKIIDLYEKESKGKKMTFLVMETVFSDDAGEPVVTERFNLLHRK